MEYVSTRGVAPAAGFFDVLLTGLAPDGGLYVPKAWPHLGKDEIRAFASRPYHEVTADLVGRFAGDEIGASDLIEMCRAAYAGFEQAMRAYRQGEFIIGMIPVITWPPRFFLPVAGFLTALLCFVRAVRAVGRAASTKAETSDI